MPIEDLAQLEVSSVTKTAEPLSNAPAAIFVITHEDIVRSGARSLPDILRLAPNLQVARITASSFAISARGFNGSAADMLLVLVDGRSVYTPFANGVFWDSQSVPPDTIDRIEVISGPGATLWGANAVNGVVNIITRKSADTQGGSIELGGGNQSAGVSVQYGGRISADLTYRAYFDASNYANDKTATGQSADDAWRRRGGGFRFDWSPSVDLITLQGDLYSGIEDEPANPSQQIAGRNILLRWNHPTGDASALQIQLYYDFLLRKGSGKFNETLNTYDIDLQQSLSSGSRHQIVWGGGLRIAQDDFVIIPNNPWSPVNQFFDPQKRTLILGDLFAQDTITLAQPLALTLGLKLEDDPYGALEPLPNIRLAWKISDKNLLWAAVSRAIRAPSRLDRDFNQASEGAVPQLQLTGGKFKPEKLIAYEVGFRTQPARRLSASVSLYYNQYQDLRSFEFTPVTIAPVVFENRLEGDTYGVEAWGAFQATDWWRLTAGANWLHKDLRFRADSSGFGGVQIAGDDPAYQVSLQSMMNLDHHVSLFTSLRGVGGMPAPVSPAYVEMDAHVTWSVTNRLELSVRGDNLLNPHHEEFGSKTANIQLGASGVETERSFYAAATWRF